VTDEFIDLSGTEHRDADREPIRHTHIALLRELSERCLSPTLAQFG
jgi:hypothetical protein